MYSRCFVVTRIKITLRENERVGEKITKNRDYLKKKKYSNIFTSQENKNIVKC